MAVINMLEQHGYECEPQVGVANYFLDLAVRDPGSPGRFLMGVECDGATYHSAKSARDRDCLRQEILESLGWRIRRIWSTDWFRNPAAQLQPILNELERLRSPIVEAVLNESSSINSIEPVQIEVFEDQNYYEEDSTIEPDRAIIENISVEDRLIRFNDEVIKVEFPKTEESKRLLRGEMLAALLEHLPTSRAEFQEFIPGFLRTNTVTCEAKFLDDILSIIADYEPSR